MLTTPCKPTSTALGLVHEHTRPDRDQYVNVNCDEISSPKTCGPDPSRWSGVARQFSVMPLPSWDVPGPYDVDSIMHYDAFAFAKGRTPVITGRPGVVFKDSGRNSPTALDARRICETYRTLCDRHTGPFATAFATLPAPRNWMPTTCSRLRGMEWKTTGPYSGRARASVSRYVAHLSACPLATCCLAARRGRLRLRGGSRHL